jgi:hypothetical protein
MKEVLFDIDGSIVVVEWLALLIHILDGCGSDLGPTTDCLV